jgi:hypothetical protein
MKKLIMMPALFAAITFSACGQKLDASKVPAAVKATFAKQYPGAIAKWEKEDGKYEATFKQGVNELSAMFEPNGTFTESEAEMKASELPASVTAYMKAHYKGKSVKGAAKITKADGSINYEAALGGKDVIFDANGNFLKEVKD